MSRNTKTMAVLVALMMVGVGLHGCNTFRGAGKDIQRGGQAIEGAADDAQHRNVGQHMIRASAQSGGSIHPSGATSARAGSYQTYTIRADRGFHVADVVVDGKSIGPVSRYTFHNVAGGHTIAARFAPNRSR